jgi:hypothetical protein
MKFKLLLIFSGAILSFFSLAFYAQASSPISVSGLESPIMAENLAPGETITRDFSAVKNNDSGQDLMISFEETAGSNLSDRIQARIKYLGDGSFAQFPNGSNTETLSDLFKENSFIFDSLAGPAGTKFDYQLRFTFDLEAGNEFQNRKTVFDLSVGIDAVERKGDNDNDGGGDNDRHRRKNNAAQEQPENLAIQNLQGAETISGPDISNSEEQIGERVEGKAASVAGTGAETCRSIPKIWFILALFSYILLLQHWLFRKINYSPKFKWFPESFLTALALIFWIRFDICRTNAWFMYLVLLSGLMIYLAYLRALKKMKSEI